MIDFNQMTVEEFEAKLAHLSHVTPCSLTLLEMDKVPEVVLHPEDSERFIYNCKVHLVIPDVLQITLDIQECSGVAAVYNVLINRIIAVSYPLSTLVHAAAIKGTV